MTDTDEPTTQPPQTESVFEFIQKNPRCGYHQFQQEFGYFPKDELESLLDADRIYRFQTGMGRRVYKELER